VHRGCFDSCLRRHGLLGFGRGNRCLAGERLRLFQSTPSETTPLEQEEEPQHQSDEAAGSEDNGNEILFRLPVKLLKAQESRSNLFGKSRVACSQDGVQPLMEAQQDLSGQQEQKAGQNAIPDNTGQKGL